MQCPFCTREINDNASFCKYCGQRINGQVAAMAAPEEGKAVFAASATTPGSSSKKKTIIILVVALVVAACVIGGVVWWMNSSGSANSADEQAQFDSDQELHSVHFAVTAPNWTNASTRIPVAIVGTDAKGIAVDQVQFIDGYGAGLMLPKGSYTLSFPASPLLEDGHIYADNNTSIEVNLGNDLIEGQAFEPDGVVVEFTQADPATVTDEQIERAAEYAQKDTAEGAAEKVPALKDNVTAVRDQAVEDAKPVGSFAAPAYRQVIAQRDSYDFETDGLSIMGWQYALVDMTGDDLPELLLMCSDDYGLETTKVFTYDKDSKTVVTISGSVVTGAAMAGGFRGGVSASNVGNGLLLSQGGSGNGEFIDYRVSIVGQALIQDEIGSYRLGSSSGSAVDGEKEQITWHDVTDDSALANLEKGA